MNRADAIDLDELKQNRGSRIILADKSSDPMIVEKCKFLYMVCHEGYLTEEEGAIAKEKLFELIKTF